MSRHPLARSTTCSPSCGPATRSSCARRSRPGTTDFVAGYLAKHRGFADRRGRLRRPRRPSGSPPGASSRRSSTLPCIVGGVGERSGEARRASCSRSSARRSCQTTPVQAELAKIWTNILRYTHFALPNLLMMDCEQLRRERLRGHRPDQPRLPARRDRPARASPPARACARTSRSREERSHAPGMLLAVSRVNESCRCSSSRAQAPPRRLAGRAQGRRARPRLQGATPTTSATRCRTSSIRLLERELADVAVHDPLVRDADPVRSRARSWTPTPSSWPPTTRRSATPAAAAIADSAPPRLPGRRPVERLGRRAGLRLRDEVAASSLPHAMSRVLVTGGAGTIGSAVVRRLLQRPRLGGPRLRPARGAGVDARGRARSTRATCATSTRRARRRAAARTSSTSRRSSAGSRTSTSSRTR